MRKRFFCVLFLFSAASVSAIRAELSTDDAAPERCIECHQTLCKQWRSSDHSHSMQHADDITVLGDFSDQTFKHIAFDDISAFSDSAVQTLLNDVFNAEQPPLPMRNYSDSPVTVSAGQTSVPYNVKGRKFLPPLEPRFDDFALACLDTLPSVRKKLSKLMTEKQRAEFIDETEYRTKLLINRPTEITAAQARIVNRIQQLYKEKKITDGDVPNPVTAYRLYRENKRFFAETEAGTFEVKFTLGVRPLQQYLVETTGGRIQCLPLAWDSIHRRWFHLYPKEQIRSSDSLHWTKSAQNWNTMCADCHTTNFQKNFNVETLTYQSTYTENNVGCSSCHGQCAKHAATARAKQFTEKWDKNVPLEVFPLSTAESEQTLDSCAFCHTRRRILKSGAKAPEEPYLNHFVPEALDQAVYYPDGQLREESFEFSSFLQSKMYSRGVSCTHCHDAHSSALKFEGNRLCTQCHSPSIYDTVKHHFHTDSSKPGTQCVECHFPQSVYMVADPRRDHSIRKPRPDLTAKTGVPNSCTLCHCDRKKGETLGWANAYVEKWYAEKRKSQVGYSVTTSADRHYSWAIRQGRQNNRQALPDLFKIVKDKSNTEHRDIVRSSALILIGQLADERELPLLAEMLQDESALVQRAAVEAFSRQSIESRLRYVPPKLNAASRAVRIEAARVLAEGAEQLSLQKTTQNESVARTFEKASQEFAAAQNALNDQAASYLNLAVFEYDRSAPKRRQVERWFEAAMTDAQRERSGQAAAETARIRNDYLSKLTDRTLALYLQSLKIEPEFIPSRINLAMLHNERGEALEAEKQFREVLRIDPKHGEAAYSLGLLLSEWGRGDESLKMLSVAAELLPDNPRVRYNLALLLMQQNKRTEARTELNRALTKEPENVALLYALTVLNIQERRKKDALDSIQKLLKQEPNRPEWQALHQSAEALPK